MLKRFGSAALIAFFLTISAPASGQESVQAQNPVGPEAQPAQPAQSAPTPGPSPRVVGEPQSQEEWGAWQLIENTPAPTEKATLALQFLDNYPESGLAPNAHYLIAEYDYQAGNFASFVEHGEKAVAELPGAADLLSQLAFVYAEGKKSDLAIERANQALERADTLGLPAYEMLPSWVAQVYQVKAEAYYALGRAYLGKLGQEKGDGPDPNLHRAINYLEAALRFNPHHDYAALRLAFAQRNAGNVEGTLLAYGRAIAIQGVASETARQQLDEVLGIVKSNMAGSEWAAKSADDVITEARARMEQEMASLQSEQAHEIHALQAELTPDGSSETPNEPTPQQ